MKKFLFVILLAPLLSSCGDKEPESLMSPCVGKSGSPCERTPVNQDILHHQNIKV